MRCIGLDLGTTKISGVAIDTDPPPGRVLGVVSREHGAGLPPARPWENLQDPGRILAAAREVLGELCEPADSAAARPEGLCVTGQMHGVLYADSGGQAVSPLMSWLDNRAGQPHPSGGTWAEALSAAVGRRIAAGYGAATHFYNRHHGLVPPRAAWLCTIMDYVTLKLTAAPTGPRRPVTDATIAASVGLAEPLSGRPDLRALEEAGLGAVLTSETRDAGSRVGSTAGGRGVPSGVPVFAPLGDNQAGFLGAVRDVEGMALLNIGTGGQVSAWLPAGGEAVREAVRAFGRAEGSTGRPSVGLEVRPFPGGGLLLVGAALCAGKAYALLEGFFRGVLETFGGRAEGALYERMNELAAGSGDLAEEGLRVDTRFNGTREDPRIRGSIQGITLRNLTPAALVRGFLEGITGELHGYFAELARVRDAPLRTLAASGNGLRLNPALREQVARRFGVRLLVPKLREEAALGAALAAAVGLGRYPGFRAAGQIIGYEGEASSSRGP
jgi:sedoheptulokinase